MKKFLIILIILALGFWFFYPTSWESGWQTPGSQGGIQGNCIGFLKTEENSRSGSRSNECYGVFVRSKNKPINW